MNRNRERKNNIIFKQRKLFFFLNQDELTVKDPDTDLIN